MSESESSCSDSERNNVIIPKEMLEAAKNITMDLLPDKSKRNYTVAYNEFKKWRKQMRTNSFDEVVFLNYFSVLSEKYAPSTLWAVFSKLKTTVNCFDQIDIGNYNKLITFLKKQSKGHVPKKSNIFTRENIVTFLLQAPDEIYLSTKVVLILGIAGALRRCEFTELLVTDFVQEDDFMVVLVRITKNKVPRSFTVEGELYEICKKYMQLRPASCSTNRFFLKYTKGKCVNQPIGINKFGTMPKDIALYLLLPDAENYTGHSFRRTSATLLADAGADIMALKRHGGWKSTSVAEGYVADSLRNKKQVFNQITTGIILNPELNANDLATCAPSTSKPVQQSIPLIPPNMQHKKASTQLFRQSSTGLQNSISISKRVHESIPLTFIPSKKAVTQTLTTAKSSPLCQSAFRKSSTGPRSSVECKNDTTHSSSTLENSLLCQNAIVSPLTKVRSSTACKSTVIESSTSKVLSAVGVKNTVSAAVELPSPSSTSEIQISDASLTIHGDSILQTCNTKSNIQNTISKEPKFPVDYHPNIGLFILDTKRTFVLNNCRVTIISNSSDNIQVNNCSVRTIQDEEGMEDF